MKIKSISYQFVLMLVFCMNTLFGYCLSAEEAYKTFKTHKAIVSELVERLKTRNDIGPLLSHEIVFVYHSDNRCDGSTDGEMSKLPGIRIDKPFKVEVINDGQGWACDKKKSSKYNIDFHLSKALKDWDRVESDKFNPKTNTVYIHGAGESDFMVFHFSKVNGRFVVNKIEYRSEDPG